jgi:hypothetical protein
MVSAIFYIYFQLFYISIPDIFLLYLFFFSGRVVMVSNATFNNISVLLVAYFIMNSYMVCIVKPVLCDLPRER